MRAEAVIAIGLGIVLPAPGFSAEPGKTASKPTFYEDVLPILQRNCQSCHRPGEIGPMPLLTYDEARPWAKAIRSAVLTKKMPPWHADPRHGEFLNDRTMAKVEIDTLVGWADQGAAPGDPSKAPKAVAFEDGWKIGKPDLVIQIPTPFHVPASGTIEYQYITFPTGFTEDKWVKAVEIRPGNRAVVHHQIASVRPHDPKLEVRAKHGEYFDLVGLPRHDQSTDMFADAGEQLQVYVPGAVPPELPEGQARLIRAGSDFLFQLHYTPIGKETTDVTSIGFVFADKPPERRVRSVLVYNTHFAIPAGEPDALVMAQAEVLQPVELVSMLPHMHLRGKDFTYQAFYPNGEVETLLSVPKYDFNWQLTYYLKQPKLLPRGTILRCVGHYDNSPNNRWNPDPNRVVPYGEQTWDEMLNGFMEVALQPDATSERVFANVPPERAAKLPPPGRLTAQSRR